jgi:flagellar biogenesis protein FliO
MIRMVVLALLIGVPSVGSAAAEKPWRLGKATVSDTQLELPLMGSSFGASDSARVHRSGQKRISVFFPDIRSRRMVRRYQRGPIKQVRMTRSRKGTTVLLTTRGAAADVIDKLVVRDVDGVTIVVDMAPEPAAVPESPAIRGARDDQEVRLADEAMPMQATIARGDSSIVASGFFVLIMAGLGSALWFIKRHKKVQLEPDSIDVVAVRAFGGRHKLALVETCGEKLLLAASDKGVTLLSHLGTPLVPQHDDETTQILSMETVESFEQFMPSATPPVTRAAGLEPEEPVPPKEAAPEPALRREEAHAFELATAKLNSGTLSADLEGLVKLREKRTAKAKHSINGLAEHLANRYKANEVAA